MKNKFLKLSMFILPVMLIWAGCEKENFDPDPSIAILGKWELIENSLGPKSYPGSYEEYRPDSVLFNFNSENDTNYSKYWIEDSILYKSHEYIIIEGSDTTTYIATEPSKFEFLTYNKLQLVLQYPAIVTWFVYKRVK